jgi:phosphoglycerol transferase
MTVRDLERPQARSTEQQIVAPHGRRTRWAVWLVPGAGAVLVTLIACWYFKVWNGGLGTPNTYSGDGLYYPGVTNAIIHHGWYFTNPNLGAPLGQVTYDYPLGYDNLNLAVIRLLAWVWRNPFVVDNLFLYLTFPAAFLASWFVLRRLGFSRPVAWVVGVVYAILPYHFLRADPHLMLSAYHVVPLGALLLYEFLGAREMDEPDAWQELSAGSWRARGARLLRSRWFWIPVVLGSGGVYYASFFVFLAVATGCLATLRDRNLRRLLVPALCSLTVAAVLVINNAPSLLYSARHGANNAAVDRHLGENDVYGLELSYLVLPMDDHRLSWFRDIKQTLATESVSPVRDSEGQALGLLSSVGLVVSVGSVLIAIPTRRAGDRWFALRRRSGVLNVLAILLATVGGISTIVGLLGLTSLRAYNRISIFIAFFSLVALGALCEAWLLRRRRPRTRFTAGVVAISLAVCAFAAFDQTPRALISTRGQVEQQLRSDRAFAQRIQQRLGDDAMVFQMPLMGSPETAISVSGQQGRYFTDELVKPSLFTDHLHWSWGAMKGRPEDLTPSFVGRPLEQLLPDLAALGFDGIYIDRRGFADRATQLEVQLGSILGGQSPMVSGEHDLSFFDLRAYTRGYEKATPRGALRAQRNSALHPLRLRLGNRFGGGFGTAAYPALDGVTFGWTAQNDAILEVANPLRAARRLMLHFGLNTPDMRPATLEVRTARTTQRFDVPSSTPLTVGLNVGPGKTRLAFRITSQPPAAPSDPQATFQIVNPWWETPLVPAKPAQ